MVVTWAMVAELIDTADLRHEAEADSRQQRAHCIRASAPNAPGMLQQGSVLMVYGLNMEKTNCTRLFNLFCLYGNVVRVSFFFKCP